MVAGLGYLPVKEGAPASQYVRLPTSNKFLIWGDDMIFVPTVDLGDAVCEGDILGHGWFVDRIDTKPKVYFAPYDRWVLCFGGQELSGRGMLLLWLPKTQLKAWLHN
jgi:N-alpha-acetyl-L-2,4-diaminobutyrate deacetylase